MSFAVERLEDENPQFSEHGGAFTEAYALIDCTFGAGAVFGPLIGGLLYEHFTWAITYGALAALCLSGSVPVVSARAMDTIPVLTISTDVVHRCFIIQSFIKP